MSYAATNLSNNDEQRDTLNLLEVVVSSLMERTSIEELEVEYFHSIATLIPAHAIGIYFLKSKELRPMRILAHGVDTDFLSFYETHGREIDPLIHWITEYRRPTQSQLLFSLKDWHHHPIYRVVSEVDFDFAMQSPIFYGTDIIATLNFGRSLSEGAFSEMDLKAVSIISNFLTLALQKLSDHTHQYRHQENFCRMMNHSQHGIIISDRDDTLLYCNATARSIAIRFLGTDQPIQDLPKVIHELSPETKDEKHNQKAFPIRSCPLPGRRDPYTLILLEDNLPAQAFKNLAGILTSREIDVIVPLVKGKQNREIAEELHISINTVKRHIENIYCKLDVNSRLELLSKIYRISHPKKFIDM